MKELAKFACGVTAWEAVVHAALLVNGVTVTLFGFTLTPEVNLIQTIIPAIVAFALAYYAWGTRRRSARLTAVHPRPRV
jgi:hypothetical protein